MNRLEEQFPVIGGWINSKAASLRARLILDHTEIIVGTKIRLFAKWTFDLVKNVLMIGAIAYLAKKVNSVILHAIYEFCTLLLSAYMSSYFQGIYFQFSKDESKKSRILINILGTASILTAAYISLNIVIQKAIMTVATAQAIK